MAISQATIPDTTYATYTTYDRITRCDDLVSRARRGDAAAWQGLVEEFTPMMHHTARTFRLSDTDCHDIVQAVWLKLVEHLGSIRDGGRIAGWLATTTRREALRTLRRREVPTEAAALDHPDPTGAPDQQVLDADDIAQVRRALDRLPERDRVLLTTLMAVPSPDYASVSAELGMPHGSIGPTRARALYRLRRELEKLPATVTVIVPAQRSPISAA